MERAQVADCTVQALAQEPLGAQARAEEERALAMELPEPRA